MGRNKIDEESEVYIKYCLLKGLLHRLDHSSSADVLVENKTEQSLGECSENSLKFKGYNGKMSYKSFVKIIYQIIFWLLVQQELVKPKQQQFGLT